jgi:DNA-binding MarR family transcriptional regulator
VDDPSDRRSVRAAITEAGCRACDAGNAIVDAIERDLVAALGQADYDRLRDALEELRVRA